MRTLLCSVALSAVIAAPAVAETRYDRNLEKAVMDIVAGKIGDIRGSFSFDVQPVSMIPQDQMSTGSIPERNASLSPSDAWRDGLAPATERKVSRIVF